MSHVKSLLLCPPTYYDIRYEINPWMNTKNPVDHAKAMEEYNTLTYAYRSLGIPYEELAPSDGLSDQVFTTDLGHAENKRFIKASFKHPERAREADSAEKHFREKGYDIQTFGPDIYFEGGDLIKGGDHYFFGYGQRSSRAALPILEEMLEHDIISIELTDDRFYHLDTCFSALDDTTALINRHALTTAGIESIQAIFPRLIETSKEDNNLLVCNLVAFENDLIMAEGVSNELKDELISLGFRVITVPMNEYLKGGGSIHCASMEIWE